MNNATPTRIITGTGVLTAAILIAATGPAEARHGGDRDRVVKRGACSERAHWKLKVKPDDGRLEVEAEVDSNRAGQVWTWTVKHNGTVLASGQRTTRGRSGEFSVERKVANRAGTDRFSLDARRTATGETCHGVVSF